MSAWIVILGGLLLGYFAVSMLIGGRRAPAPPPVPPPAPVEPDWREVLGIAADASEDEMRAAYRRLMSQYHPDKVASLGPELQALAERKSKQIAQAYADALATRGLVP